MKRILFAVLLAVVAQTATAQEYKQVTEYVTVREKICGPNGCQYVDVRRPVTRLVKVATDSGACVVSSLADVVTAPARAVDTYVDPEGYHRHKMEDGSIMSHHDDNNWKPGAHDGAVGYYAGRGVMRYPKYTGPLAPGLLATVPTAESLDVSQYVDYAAIERATGLRFFERWRERRQMRREGRLTNMTVFARTGINRRLQALANFMPRAWFNLR